LGKSAKRVFALDVPGIHVLTVGRKENVDDRVKPGHDGGTITSDIIEFGGIAAILVTGQERHREERSDEAISTCFGALWIASLRSQ